MIKTKLFKFMQQVSVRLVDLKPLTEAAIDGCCQKLKNLNPNMSQHCKIFLKQVQCQYNNILVGLMMIKMKKLLIFNMQQISVIWGRTKAFDQNCHWRIFLICEQMDPKNLHWSNLNILHWYPIKMFCTDLIKICCTDI